MTGSGWQGYVLGSLFSLLIFFTTSAQEIKVWGRFSSDSVQIGKPIEYYLSVHHPEHTNLLFPDSSFSFSPFEFQKKKITVTQTKNGVSVDSVIYFLATYEIDSLQRLKLPVFVVTGKDCTQVYSNTDTVYLKHLVKSIPDSVALNQLPLKSNTHYLDVRWNLNYILLAIGSGLLFIIFILVWIIFGKRIKKYFKLRRLTKGYRIFLLQYEGLIDLLQKDFSVERAEQSLVVWKKYLETLTHIPYTKFTSKEIRSFERDETLGTSLSAIDRLIYGGLEENHRIPFDSLKDYVHRQYEKKKAEVANG